MQLLKSELHEYWRQWRVFNSVKRKPKQIKMKLSRYPAQTCIKIGSLEWNYQRHRRRPSECPVRLSSFPVKTSDLPDKCPMTGTNLQPCLCVPWEFKLLCNRITRNQTQNPGADSYTISARQLSNRRGNFKVWSKEREQPKPKVFRCFKHRALIEVTALKTVCKQAVRDHVALRK